VEPVSRVRNDKKKNGGGGSEERKRKGVSSAAPRDSIKKVGKKKGEGRIWNHISVCSQYVIYQR